MWGDLNGLSFFHKSSVFVSPPRLAAFFNTRFCLFHLQDILAEIGTLVLSCKTGQYHSYFLWILLLFFLCFFHMFFVSYFPYPAFFPVPSHLFRGAVSFTLSSTGVLVPNTLLWQVPFSLLEMPCNHCIPKSIIKLFWLDFRVYCPQL